MSGRGHQRERAVGAILRSFGYVLGSRRHEGGAADWLAVRALEVPLLIEVKGTSDLPWRSSWSPQERQSLIDCAAGLEGEALLAWWPPGLRGGPIWLPPEDWPLNGPRPRAGSLPEGAAVRDLGGSMLRGA